MPHHRIAIALLLLIAAANGIAVYLSGHAGIELDVSLMLAVATATWAFFVVALGHVHDELDPLANEARRGPKSDAH